jgi:RND superfamily putative drug exporter
MTGPMLGGAHDPGPGGRFAWLAFAADRRAKWVVVALGLVVLVVGAGLSGRLNSVEQQNPLDYLPPHAQSTQVEQLEARFPAGQSEQAIVVFHRASGLTADDLALVADDRSSVGAHYIPYQTPPTAVRVSPNRTTAYFSTTLPIADNLESIVYEVKRIRSLVGTGTGGMQIAVTGSAAYLTDGADALQGNGGTLLLVAVAIAAFLLLLIYRSPVLWFLPLLCVFASLTIAEGAAALLGKHLLTVSGQATGILTVLVIGVGTDYGLLLISRYREELHHYDDHHQAMAVALRRAGPAIVASGSTVALALLCLLASTLSSDRGLGPVCAIGVVVAVVFMLTVLPALLVILGRGVFWPFVPAPPGHAAAAAARPGPWARLAGFVADRHRVVGLATAGVLVVMCCGLAGLHTDLTAAEQYRTAVGSVEGQQLVADGFPGGTAAPLVVMVRPAHLADAARRAASGVAGVASVGGKVTTVDGVARFEVVTDGAEGTPAANTTVVALRAALSGATGGGALVGGPSAVDYDVGQGTTHDARVVIPLVLLVVLLVLLLLLRAVVGPLLLVLTVVLSFGAALGVSAVANTALFGFGASSPYLPLYGFIFLVALGCDYNIFLTARVREEAVGHGTREGTRRALATTGTVIASAGIVLAGTFAALAVEPLVVLAELGFLVAFGVLLDTFVVRTFLVPALTIELGPRWWWPAALSRREATEGAPAVPSAPTVPTAPSAPTVPVAPIAPAAPVATPAGWFPDPSGDPTTLRYWDGTRWTEHTARGG